MQPLSFEQAPPSSVPLRFFLSAPVFLLFAGLVALLDGEAVFASRWSAPALALTHLITTGFMLQVMCGALFQLMPVAAGANLWRPAVLAWPVHVVAALGAACLSAGFYRADGRMLVAGGVLLGMALSLFIVASLIALWRTPAQAPTVVAMRWAVACLCLTVMLGLGMALARGDYVDAGMLRWSPVHVAVGLAGWGGVLVAGAAYLVVPMFQLTPAYPDWFARAYVWVVVASLALGALLDSALGWLPLLVAIAAFAAMTLDRQRRRRRARRDMTLRLWQLAMGCVLAACVLGVLPLVGVGVAPLTLLVAVLVLYGGFVSLTVGMLYKIVPFVLWLYLQPRLSNVPPMTRMLSEPLIRWHFRLHVGALAVALLAVAWPPLGGLAGGLILVAGGVLAAQLIGVGRQARRALLRATQPS